MNCIIFTLMNVTFVPRGILYHYNKGGSYNHSIVNGGTNCCYGLCTGDINIILIKAPNAALVWLFLITHLYTNTSHSYCFLYLYKMGQMQEICYGEQVQSPGTKWSICGLSYQQQTITHDINDDYVYIYSDQS